MNSGENNKKIIHLAAHMATKQKESMHAKKANQMTTTRVIAITSGKGGVGKTNIAANLGFALQRMGRQVLILDGDLGLANIDVLLGLTPKYNLSHVISGQKSISDIIVKGPEKLKILPASSGIQELTLLSKEHKIKVLTDLDSVVDQADILLIDTAAGISSNVMDLIMTAQEIMVVVTPEPTSITDAYALMKVLSLKYAENRCKLLVNMAASDQEADEVYRQLNLVAGKFLNFALDYCGFVLRDEKVAQGVRRQKIVSEIYPDAEASLCFEKLARKILIPPPLAGERKRDSNFNWQHLVGNGTHHSL